MVNKRGRWPLGGTEDIAVLKQEPEEEDKGKTKERNRSRGARAEASCVDPQRSDRPTIELGSTPRQPKDSTVHRVLTTPQSRRR